MGRQIGIRIYLHKAWNYSWPSDNFVIGICLTKICPDKVYQRLQFLLMLDLYVRLNLHNVWTAFGLALTFLCGHIKNPSMHVCMHAMHRVPKIRLLNVLINVRTSPKLFNYQNHFKKLLKPNCLIEIVLKFSMQHTIIKAIYKLDP